MPRLAAPPKRRLVRQQSLWSRLSSYPFDLWLSVSEDIQLVDWDSFAQPVAIPVGVAATVILWFCRIYVSGFRSKNTVTQSKSWFRRSTPDDIFADPKYNLVDSTSKGFGSGIFKATSSFIAYIVSLLSIALVIICLLNAVYCFITTKHYTLMARASDNPPDTPSAHRVKYDDGSKGKIETEIDDDDNNKLWSLDMWDPPIFNIHLSTTFSPLHLFIIWYGPVSIFQLLLLVALSGYLYMLVHKFLVLVKDKSVVHGEVLGEYGKKLVQPIIAVARRDVCVGTDSDIVEVYTPARPSKFVTHDVRDRPVLAPSSWGSPAHLMSTERASTISRASVAKPWSAGGRSASSSPVPQPRSPSVSSNTSARPGNDQYNYQSPLANRSRFISSRPSLRPQ